MKKKKFRGWIVPKIWIALLFIISSIPLPASTKAYRSVILRFLLSGPVTHMAHMVMFGILGFLLGRSFRKSFPLMGKRNSILWTFLVSFLIALAMEVYQQLVIPGRGFEIKDLTWDLLGIGAAIIYLSIALPKATRRPHLIS